MAAGISIGVAMDTRQAASAINSGMLDPLEDVSTALDDVARDSTQANGKVVSGLKDSARAAETLGKEGDKAGDKLVASLKDAQKATDRTGDDYKTLGRVIDRESKEAGRNFGQNIKRGTDEAEDGLREMGDETQSTAKEFAASFDGSISSVGDAIQELAANAFVGFGPAGVVAGIAAAVGIGALFTAIQAGAEESEQRVQGMYEDMIASGDNFISRDALAQAVQAIQENTAKYALAQQDAADTGVALSTVLLAQAGDTASLSAVEEARRVKLEALQAQQTEHIRTTTEESDTLATQINTLETMGLRYDKVAASTETAAAKADVYRQTMDSVGQASDGASEGVQKVIDKVNALPPNKTIRLDVDDSALEAALTRQEGRTIHVNINGQIDRIGNQVW